MVKLWNWLLLQVLLRAKHIVSSSNPRLTLLALDIMAQGCSDLSDYESKMFIPPPPPSHLSDYESKILILFLCTFLIMKLRCSFYAPLPFCLWK